MTIYGGELSRDRTASAERFFFLESQQILHEIGDWRVTFCTLFWKRRYVKRIEICGFVCRCSFGHSVERLYRLDEILALARERL